MIHYMVNHMDSTFSALADPSRRQVLELLGAGPLRASELAEGVGLARNAMSRHLRLLRSSGLVEVELSEEDARSRIYRLRAGPLEELEEWVEQLRASWEDQLARFKRYAEGDQ